MNTEAKSQLRRYIVLAASGFMLSFLLLLTTNPTRLPILFILLLPATLALTAYSASMLLASLFLQRISQARQRLISAAIASGLVIIIVLGSLKQLGGQDLLFTVLLIAGLVFYAKRTVLVREQD